MKCQSCLKEITQTEVKEKKCIYCADWNFIEISTLKLNENNPRQISRDELRKLVRNIKEIGFTNPILVNNNEARKNYVIAGHQRIQAMKELGRKIIPVHFINLDYDKEQLANIADNEISGEWDEDKLYNLLKELNEQGSDLTLSGFDEPMIDEILARDRLDEKERNIDKVPPTPTTPITKTGDVWILGRHRIMCGDSTSEKDFDKLMNGKTADLCWTDPPYGVSYKGTNNPNGRDWGVMNADDLRKDDLFNFLLPIYKNIFKHTKDKAALYSCYASSNHIIFENALMEAGFRVKQQLIWSKGHVLGHSDYHWCHEPILYCAKKDENSEWYGDRTHKTMLREEKVDLKELNKEQLLEILTAISEQSDVIEIQKDASQTYLHPTQKPVALSRGMIKNSSRPNELVIEPCSGSGSTLMACETGNRTCFAMEISPAFVDVCVKRWEDYTGQKAKRE